MPVTITDSATLGRTNHWQVTIEERRQRIRDLAKCKQCGTDQKTCITDDTGDKEGPGSLCCWGGIGHGHVEDRRLVDELLREVASGEVRTVAEAYPPPVRGPRLPGYEWLLYQDVWWYPYRRPAVRIAEMDKPYRLNTARFVERHAFGLHMTVGMRWIGDDAPDDVWRSWEQEQKDPAGWLRRTPLLVALRKGLPGGGAKLRALEVRALHWHTCPMRLAHPATGDRCTCVRVDGRCTGATNDPNPVPVPDRMRSTETWPEPS